MRLRFDAWRSGGRVEIGARVRLRTRVIFRGRGLLRIGDDAVLGDRDAGMPGAPIYFAPRGENSMIAIDAGTRVSNGVELIALDRIEVGEECLIGAGARFLDADFHGVAPEERRTLGSVGAVSIGRRVLVGMGALILKRVRVGDGALIGAGAVVVRDVERGAVVGGNPARVISRWVAAARG
jgi:acetyltransferase-like isoleucine patch superfamily enzyme